MINYNGTYKAFFDILNVHIAFKHPWNMSNINGVPLSKDYSKLDSILMQVGPYIRITDSILNDAKYRYFAEYFYQLKYNLTIETILLRELNIVKNLSYYDRFKCYSLQFGQCKFYYRLVPICLRICIIF